MAWTLYEGKLTTSKCDSSDPDKDDINFKNLAKQLLTKFEEFRNGKCDAEIDKDGNLWISCSEDEPWINFTSKGVIEVGIPAA